MLTRRPIPRYRIASLIHLDQHAIDFFLLFQSAGDAAFLPIEFLVEPAAVCSAVDTATP